MKVLCLGAGLQGLEVAYLGLKAGWNMTLVDKRRKAPASGLARTLTVDLSTLNAYQLGVLCAGFDLIVPALEDQGILEFLFEARAREFIPPLAFDMAAYRLSSSKILSKKLFKKLNLPMARDWVPGLKGPFVVKPSNLSGSRGVRFCNDTTELNELKASYPGPEVWKNMVVEEWLKGPSYSIEVTGAAGKFKTHQVTLLEMDDIYDCCKITAPSGLPRNKEEEFAAMAERLAVELSLTGLMDLEAIYHKGSFKLLEIDARFPSQTPITVYWSTGVNLLVEMASCFVPVRAKSKVSATTDNPRKVIFEQFLFTDGKKIPHGEHIFTTMGPVKLMPGFMDSQEALVAGNPKSGYFAATLINYE
jgi:pyrrolysine biosynthesis protein PylC